MVRSCRTLLSYKYIDNRGIYLWPLSVLAKLSIEEEI